MAAGLDMVADTVEHCMNGLAALGDEVSTKCRGARTDVESLSASLGKGPLGTRFAAVFRPAWTKADDLITAAELVPSTLADAGTECVRVYLTADAHARAELLRATVR